MILQIIFLRRDKALLHRRQPCYFLGTSSRTPLNGNITGRGLQRSKGTPRHCPHEVKRSFDIALATLFCLYMSFSPTEDGYVTSTEIEGSSWLNDIRRAVALVAGGDNVMHSLSIASIQTTVESGPWSNWCPPTPSFNSAGASLPSLAPARCMSPASKD